MWNLFSLILLSLNTFLHIMQSKPSNGDEKIILRWSWNDWNNNKSAYEKVNLIQVMVHEALSQHQPATTKHGDETCVFFLKLARSCKPCASITIDGWRISTLGACCRGSYNSENICSASFWLQKYSSNQSDDTCLLCNDVSQIHLAWQFMEDQNSNVSGYTQLNYLLNKGTIKWFFYVTTSEYRK